MACALIERDGDYENQYRNLALSSIRIDNYFAKISSIFFQSKARQVWKVVFIGMTSLKNIMGALRYLENLEFLEFRNISLDEYNPNKWDFKNMAIPSLLLEKQLRLLTEPGNENLITAPRLVYLKLINSAEDGTLTRSELLLFDFLTNTTELGSLSSLEINNLSGTRLRRTNTVNENGNSVQTNPEDLNEVNLKYGTKSYPLSPLTFVKFINKNAANLRDLKLSRNFLEFYTDREEVNFGSKFSISKNLQEKVVGEAGEVSTEMTLRDLENIQLKYLTIRNQTLGIHHLLKCQRNLENFCCEESPPSSSTQNVTSPLTSPLTCDPKGSEETLRKEKYWNNYIKLCTAFGSCIENCWSSIWTIKTFGIVPFFESDWENLDNFSSSSSDSEHELEFKSKISGVGGTGAGTGSNFTAEHQHDHEIRLLKVGELGNGNELVYDFSKFQYCTQLRYLKFDNYNLELQTTTGQSQSQGHQGQRLKLVRSTFINGHLLPVTLTTLSIKVGHVIPEEFKRLTERIPFLLNLRQFLVTSKEMFQLNFECLQNMLQDTPSSQTSQNHRSQGQNVEVEAQNRAADDRNRNRSRNGNSRERSRERALYNIELENAQLSHDMPAHKLQQLLQRMDVRPSSGRRPQELSQPDLEQGQVLEPEPEPEPEIRARSRSHRYWSCEIRPRGIFFEKWVNHESH